MVLYGHGKKTQSEPGNRPGTPQAARQGPDLVQEAGEGPRHVAFEGELAVLPGGALGDGPLEQHAGHAVPVAGADSVSLQSDVGGRLEGKLVSKLV